MRFHTLTVSDLVVPFPVRRLVPSRAATVAPWRSLAFFAPDGTRRRIHRKDDTMSATNPITGLLITAGETREITIDSTDTVTAIAGAIGCEVFTVVGLQDGIDVYVDDEGLINGSSLNLALTIVAHRLGSPAVLFGNGLVVSVDDNGETVSLTEQQRALVLEAMSSKPDTETIDLLCESLSPLPGVVELLRAVR